MRVAVLGAGAMGEAAARLIARHPVDLLVLDSDPGRAKAAAERAEGARARAVDGSSEDLAAALEGVDAVAACVPYRVNLHVMHAALRARCRYADLGGLYHMTLRQLELDEAFRTAGLPALLGIGMAPGITNLLARLGAERLDAVESIDLVNGAIDESGDFGIPYSAETILDEFGLPAIVYEDGRIREVAAASGAVRRRLPDPVGEVEAVYTLHSELATLPRTIEGVRDVRWRLALPPAVAEGFRLLATLGLIGGEPVEIGGTSVIPRDVLLAVLARLPRPTGPPTDVEATEVRVAGTRDGRPGSFVGRVLCRPPAEGISAGAFGTALPVAVAVRWLAAGRVPPGVHPPETALPAGEFLGELAAEGLELTFADE